MTKATIHVPGLKVAVSLAADAGPATWSRGAGPAGEPTIDLVLDGGSLTVRAKLNSRDCPQDAQAPPRLCGSWAWRARGRTDVAVIVLVGAGSQVKGSRSPTGRPSRGAAGPR